MHLGHLLPLKGNREITLKVRLHVRVNIVRVPLCFSGEALCHV
jgi:hypothetical protein